MQQYTVHILLFIMGKEKLLFYFKNFGMINPSCMNTCVCAKLCTVVMYKDYYSGTCNGVLLFLLSNRSFGPKFIVKETYTQ